MLACIMNNRSLTEPKFKMPVHDTVTPPFYSSRMLSDLAKLNIISRLTSVAAWLDSKLLAVSNNNRLRVVIQCMRMFIY